MAPQVQLPGGGGGVPVKGYGAQNQVIDPAQMNKFRQPLYDRLNLAAALSGDYRFFTNPIGQSVTLITYETAGARNKTKRDTILQTNGTDNSRDYSVHGIAMALIPNARTVVGTATTNGIRRDKDNIKEAGFLNFKVVDTNIIDIPLLLIPEINAETAIASTANNATIMGGPAPFGPMWAFGEPYHIPKATAFSVTVTFDTITLSQSFDMLLVFYATVLRPR